MMMTFIFVLGVVWIWYNARAYPKLVAGSVKLQPVTICIPLRNEQQRIAPLIHTLKQLRYDNLEILLYNDESTDQTAEKVRAYIDGDARFTLIEGGPLPAGWKAKPHACYQLAKRATGEYILFIDANVTLYRDTISAVVQTFQTYRCDALTGIPRFINHSLLAKLLTPLLHFFVYMHVPITIVNNEKLAFASTASGTFMAMTKSCYEATGGHELVKNEQIQNDALFRALKRFNYKAMLFEISDYVCYETKSSSATWNGFLQQSFARFNNIIVATMVMVFYLFYFVAPLFMLIYGIIHVEWLLAIPYICITLQRVVSDYYSKSVNIFTLCMPIASLLYVILLVHAMARFVLVRPQT